MKKINIFFLLVSFLIHFNLSAKTNQTPDKMQYDGLIISLKSGVDIKKVMQEIAGELKSTGISDSEMKKDRALGRDIILLKLENKSSAALLSEKSIKELLINLNGHPGVEFAEPNYLRTINFPDSEKLSYNNFNQKTFSPMDPDFSKLWGLKNNGGIIYNPYRGENSFSVKNADIDAMGAWAVSTGSKSVKIAVIDTGVDYNHPDLKNQIYVNQAELNGLPGVDDDGNGYVDDIHGFDFVDNDGDPMDENYHGTHVAGTIGAAHNNIGISGVMKRVTIVPIRFLGFGGGTILQEVKSIEYAIKLNVDIMSNSYGGIGFSNLEKLAIEAANAKGILFTAAAGNDAEDNEGPWASYPASYDVDNIISVGSIKPNFLDADDSNYGNNVHIYAPGVEILSTAPGSAYQTLSGTSMATPHISGILGLLIAHEGRQDVKSVRDRLMETSTPLTALKWLVNEKSGMVDAHRFLDDRRNKKPDPSKWQTIKVKKFDMSNYQINTDRNVKYQIYGAKFIRLKLNEMDIEDEFDLLEIRDKDDRVADVLTGYKTNVRSSFVNGDTIKLVFRSDHLVNYSGFVVEELEVIFDD